MLLSWAFMAVPVLIAASWLTFVVWTYSRIRQRWLWAVVSVLTVPLAFFLWTIIGVAFWWTFGCSHLPGESC